MAAAGNVAWLRVEKSRCGEGVDVTDISMALLFPLEGCLLRGSQKQLGWGVRKDSVRFLGR